MNRITEIGDLSIDLGNIRNLRFEAYNSGYDGGYAVIELLHGSEYLIDPDTGERILKRPIIKEGFGKIHLAHSFLDTIRKEWNDYLKHRNGEDS